jgi:hypothetical protein
VPAHLIHSPVAPDLSAAGADIKQGIDAGRIKGIAVVVDLGRGRFFVDVFGTLVRDPHTARGWVASLDDCLRDLAHRHNESATTY